MKNEFVFSEGNWFIQRLAVDDKASYKSHIHFFNVTYIFQRLRIRFIASLAVTELWTGTARQSTLSYLTYFWPYKVDRYGLFLFLSFPHLAKLAHLFHHSTIPLYGRNLHDQPHDTRASNVIWTDWPVPLRTTLGLTFFPFRPFSLCSSSPFFSRERLDLWL